MGAFSTRDIAPFQSLGWQVTMMIKYWDSKGAADIYCPFYTPVAIYELDVLVIKWDKRCCPYLLNWIKAKGCASKMPVLGKQKPAQKIGPCKENLPKTVLFLMYHLGLCTEMDTNLSPNSELSQPVGWLWQLEGQHTSDTPVPTTCLREAALSFHSLVSARYLDTEAGRRRESSSCQGTGTPVGTLQWWAREPEGTPEWGPILDSGWGSLRKEHREERTR